jgi:hypothetical protein
MSFIMLGDWPWTKSKKGRSGGLSLIVLSDDYSVLMKTEASRLPPFFWPFGGSFGETFAPALLSPEDPQPRAIKKKTPTVPRRTIRATLVFLVFIFNNAPPRFAQLRCFDATCRLYPELARTQTFKCSWLSAATSMMTCVNHIVTRFACSNAKLRQLLQTICLP